MALRVWLPLNGTLENKGVSDPTIGLIGTPTVNNSGKIGKCYTFSGSNGVSIAQQILPSQTPAWSFACWFSLSNTTTTSASCLFSERTAANQNGYTVFIYPNNSRMLIDDGTRWTVIPMTFSAGIWYHLVVTRDSLGKKIYINGELKSSTTTIGNTTAVNTNGCLVGLAQSSAALETGDQGFIGNLNDVRIYDHCLSPKEVKEISQGLVLHYKLDGLSQGSGNNLVIGLTKGGQTTVVGNTIVTSGENADTYFKINLSSALILNKSYTIGIDAENLPDGGYFNFPIGAQNNTAGAIRLYNGHNELTFVANDTIVNCGTSLMMDDNARTAWPNQCIFKNFYIYENVSITDSSGYGNNGTIVGTLTTQQDSPRYGVSTSFAASSAINCGRGAMVTDSITVNLWAKYSSYSNLVSCTEGGGWNFENNSGLTFPVYIASVGYVHIDAANRPPVANYANSWHMFTGVYDRLNKLTKLYIDGELIGTGAVSSPNLIQYNGSNVIWLNAEATGSNETGSYGNAKSFSDFRIYATALSTEDILDLYHTPANVDNLQNIHAFELKEQSGNMFAGSPMTGTVTWDATNNYYTITSNPSTSTLGIGPAVGTSPKKIIPWGMSYILTYEVYSPTPAQWYIDYNNNDPTTSLSGNDNDNGRLRTGVNVPANTWTLITYGCSNTNETKNPDHLPLYDYSTGLGPVMTNISSAITWHMRNPQWYLVDADNEEHVYESGVFQANFIKEDNQSSYTSFRNEEKAAWAHEFIEK